MTRSETPSWIRLEAHASRRDAAAVAVAILAASPLASAQTHVEGFALNAFEPSDRGSDWFALQSLDVAVPIESQLYAHLGASLAVSEKFRVGLSLPVAIRHEGSSGFVGPLEYDTESGTAAGDLRLSAHWLLTGEHRGPLRAGLGVLLHFPTGRQ